MNELIKELYLDKDFNCAETILLALNEKYKLNIPAEEIKLVGGFGGGMGCGNACGALCAVIAALGKLKIEGRAHATPGFKEACAGFASLFEETLGATDCMALKAKYFQEGVRCLKTVEETARIADEYISSL